ncbi:hypothetical protein HQ520_13125 [bacterium]|nr:hypothetical protein [bacterium]
MSRHVRIFLVLLACIPLWGAWGENVANPRFEEMLQKIDAGGESFGYISTEDYLEQLLDRFEEAIKGKPESAGAVKRLQDVRKFLTTAGFFGVEGIGWSSIQTGEWPTVKGFAQIPEGRKGYLEVLGDTPHEFTSLAYAPVGTDLFCESDFDLARFLQVTREVIQKIQGPEKVLAFDQGLMAVDPLLTSMVNQFATVGNLINSLEGRYVFLMDLDESRPLEFSFDGEKATVEGLRVALLVKTKNALLYRTFLTLLSMRGLMGPEEISGEQGQPNQVQKAPLVNLPVVGLKPVLAFDGQYFILATQVDLLNTLLETKNGASNLSGNAEYRRLSQGLPAAGNSLFFASQPFLEAMVEMRKESLEEAWKTSGMSGASLAQAADMSIPECGIMSVQVNEPKGILWMRNGSAQSQGQAAAALMGAVTAAIAVPSFLEAQSRAQGSRAQSDMRSLATALESYSIDNKSYPAPERYADWEVGGYHGPYGRGLSVLSTPVSYISEIPEDPFSPAGSPYLYHYWKGNGWILLSLGPDQDLDVNPVRDYVVGSREQPLLFNKTFDPTNGATSDGDIWRLQGNMSQSVMSPQPKPTAVSRNCAENLLKLDAAKEQYALEANLSEGTAVEMSDLVGMDKYLRQIPICPNGGTYTLGVLGQDPTCSCGATLP